MSIIETYRDVLSERSQHANIVGSAWTIVLALIIAIVLFA